MMVTMMIASYILRPRTDSTIFVSCIHSTSLLKMPGIDTAVIIEIKHLRGLHSRRHQK